MQVTLLHPLYAVHCPRATINLISLTATRISPPPASNIIAGYVMAIYDSGQLIIIPKQELSRYHADLEKAGICLIYRNFWNCIAVGFQRVGGDSF